jgi:hypothetical protein
MKEFGRMSLTAAADVGDFESSDAKLQRRITLIGLIGLAVSIQVGSGWLLATLAAVSRSGPAAIISTVRTNRRPAGFLR